MKEIRSLKILHFSYRFKKWYIYAMRKMKRLGSASYILCYLRILIKPLRNEMLEVKISVYAGKI